MSQCNLSQMKKIVSRFLIKSVHFIFEEKLARIEFAEKNGHWGQSYKIKPGIFETSARILFHFKYWF